MAILQGKVASLDITLDPANVTIRNFQPEKEVNMAMSSVIEYYLLAQELEVVRLPTER